MCIFFFDTHHRGQELETEAFSKMQGFSHQRSKHDLHLD